MNTCEIEHTDNGVSVHCYYGTDTIDKPYQIRVKGSGAVIASYIAFEDIPTWIKGYVDGIDRGSKVAAPTLGELSNEAKDSILKSIRSEHQRNRRRGR